MGKTTVKKKNFFIITGAAKGLGKSLAEKLAGEDSIVVIADKQGLTDVVREVKENSGEAREVNFDLAQVGLLEDFMKKVFSQIDLSQANSIVLINNAGVVMPAAFAGNCDLGSVVSSLNVNCIAPIALSGIFINRVKDFQEKKMIINITSGAADRPIEGWSLYCSAKAALNRYTSCVSLEQQRQTAGMKIFKYDPGAVDTDMQRLIRESDEKDFPEVERFIDWKKKGTLKKPEDAAEEIKSFIIKELVPDK